MIRLPIHLSPATWRGQVVGVALVGLGILLLGTSGGYYVYAAVARSGLEDLNYTVEGQALGDTALSGKRNIEAEVTDGSSNQPAGRATSNPPTLPSIATREGTPDSSAPEKLVDLYSQYPGTQIGPRYWGDPMSAEPPDPKVEAVMAEAATYSDSSSADFGGDAPPATRIRVPAIDVDSELKELKIIDLGDSRAWETPKWVVGHIPTTATPGQPDQGWYFGHLETPLRGEGNVFQRLPDIPGLLRQGKIVYVFLEGPDRKYLYEVYKTEVVPEEELQLTNSGRREITLVACVPRLVYDHRILVTAKLVGVKGI